MNIKTIALAAMIGAAIGALIGTATLSHAHAGSPALVTWSNGTTLTASDLNNSFAHIHNTFSGGIVDAHISASAAISHSKLATPALLPKAWVQTDDGAGGCSSSPCTVVANSKVTSVARTSQGVYTITLAYAPTDAHFLVSATAFSAAVRFCHVVSLATAAPQVTINCRDNAGAVQDTNLMLSVMDDN